MESKYSASQRKFLKEVGKNIWKFRQRKKLSQEALASKANLDRTYMGSVERGERNVSVLNLKKIADALGVHTSVLLSGLEDSKGN